MSGLRYTWKAQFGWGWLALLAVLAIMVALLLGDSFRSRGAPRQVRDLAFMLEVYLPLALAVLLARVPVLDREAGAAELHLSWRRPAGLHLLTLLAVPLALWALAAGGVSLIAHIWYLALPWEPVLEMALYPAVGLAGAALTGSALARHQVGGMLAATLWWGIDLQVPGRINTLAYLFNTYHPVPGLEPDLMRLNLVLACLGGLVMALWLAGRRERWVSGAAAPD